MVTSPVSPTETSTSSGIGGGLSFSAYGNSSAASGNGRLAGNGAEDRRGGNGPNGIGLGRPGMKPSISLSDNISRSQTNQHPFSNSPGYNSNSQVPYRNGQSSRPGIGMMQKSMSGYPGQSSSSGLTGNIPRPGSADRSFSATSQQSRGYEHSRQRSRGGSDAPQLTNGSGMPHPQQASAEDVARNTAKVHWRALRAYLWEYLQAEVPGSRASAREKLTRLTKGQFQELSTDVYDELVRREDVEAGRGDENPFLPVRTDFHPKRNQARQKLATLPKNRFKDLASDVFYELNRRFPDFKRDAPSDMPRQEMPQSVSAQSQSAGESPMSAYPPTAAPPKQSTSSSQQSRQAPYQTSNEVVVPKKSTIAEETIEVPFARRSPEPHGNREGLSSPLDLDRPSSGLDMIEGETRRRSKRLSNQSRRSGTGVQEYEERLESPVSERNDSAQSLQMSRSQSQDNSRSHLQVNHSRSNSTTPPLDDETGSAGHARQGSSTTLDLIRERKMRTDLEAKLAGMERRLASMQREVDGSSKREEWERSRTRELEDEIRSHKDRAGTMAENVRSLQRELEAAKASREQEEKRNEGRRKEEQAELSMWKDRCRDMEDQLAQQREQLHISGSRSNQAENDDAVRDLRNELTVLMEELGSLAVRNEELLADRDEDAAIIKRLDAEVQEYKRRWEATKTDLRNLKATSMMFVSRPVTEDHMPASADGNIADIHVTQFQNAIDSLLQAARSSQPSSVLSAMKEVVVAISEISQDVKAFEREPNFPVDDTRLESLKHQSSATLNSLMSAARSHATSSGLSPISLIDAAAGHVSTNVIDLIKLLKIRKTVKPSLSSASVGRRSFSEMSEARRRSSGALQTLNTTSTMTSGDETDDDETADRQHGLLSPSRALHRAEQQQNSGQTTAYESSPKPSSKGSPQRQARSGSAVSFASSAGQRSDAFDLERKASIAGLKAHNVTSAISTDSPVYRSRPNDIEEADPVETVLPTLPARPGVGSRLPPGSVPVPPINSTARSEFSSDRSSEIPAESSPSFFAGQSTPSREEWDNVKPYLSQQSSALVNAIQQLLAEIRNGSNPATAANSNSQLSEYLSQVIAISSSIVAVSSKALPPQHEAKGQPLLDDMMNATERLSEHQNSTDFSKHVRQEIASAAFGTAKSLRALMKLDA